MAFSIVLKAFSGPLDLLWHLIRQNELDIADIPIAQITSQYLAYLHEMQELRLDVAGDYFVLAANLMAMKSQLLLPVYEDDADLDQEEVVDPRAALVAQLLTYQVYQEAAADLKQKAAAHALTYVKEPSLAPAESGQSLAPGAVKLRELTAAMNRVLTRNHQVKETVAHIKQAPQTVSMRIDHVLSQLRQAGSCTFDALLEANTPTVVVVTFLAILELLKTDQIDCDQPEPTAPILVTLRRQNDASTD